MVCSKLRLWYQHEIVAKKPLITVEPCFTCANHFKTCCFSYICWVQFSLSSIQIIIWSPKQSSHGNGLSTSTNRKNLVDFYGNWILFQVYVDSITLISIKAPGSMQHIFILAPCIYTIVRTINVQRRRIKVKNPLFLNHNML